MAELEKPVRYQLDQDGFYAGLAVIDPNPEVPGEWLIPGNTVDVAPPPPMEGKRRHWTGTEWEYVAIPDPEYQFPPPTPEQTLESRRGEALEILASELTMRLSGMFSAQPDGPSGVTRMYPAGQADQLLLMMAAQQAMTASATWTTNLRCMDTGETTPKYKKHNKTQVLNVVAAWQLWVMAIQEDNDARVAAVEAATTIEEINAALGLPTSASVATTDDGTATA